MRFMISLPFLCSLRGEHTISEEDEDNLHDARSGEFEARCERCGMPLKLKVDDKHPDTCRSGVNSHFFYLL
jgi:hypothetical protein